MPPFQYRVGVFGQIAKSSQCSPAVEGNALLKATDPNRQKKMRSTLVIPEYITVRRIGHGICAAMGNTTLHLPHPGHSSRRIHYGMSMHPQIKTHHLNYTRFYHKKKASFAHSSYPTRCSSYTIRLSEEAAMLFAFEACTS